MGASPMPLLVTSTARISNVCSSIPPLGECTFACRAVDVYLAPKTALRATMFARVPLTFALGFDAGAVHKKMLRSS